MRLFGDAYTPIKAPNEKLKETREQLIPLPGINIKISSDNNKDSEDIIGPKSSRQEIEFAMIQLLSLLKKYPGNEDLATIVDNNLGCAYVWLGRYSQAKLALQTAIDKAQPGSLVQKAARHNLFVVKSITEG